MSNLPPYSTYRTDTKQMMFPQATSHGNILTFTPPGFKHQLNVKFPDSRLAVCAKCKKNFKTRDMCRVRNTHTTAPWSTAYICITIDDSCLDENGKYVDKPLTLRMVQWQPFAVKKPFDSKTPVCAGCKRTNRTRSFCRERHRHRQLPWCTVYVLLSALDQADPSTVVAGASRQVDNNDIGDDQLKTEPEKTTYTADDDSKPRAEDTSTGGGSETISSDAEGGEGDDINDIAESRTFLAKVSCRGSSIHWLDLVEYESNDPQHFEAPENAAAAYPQPPPPPVDPNHPQAQYYAHAHYAAQQQHQNALKSHQQFFFQMQQQQQRQYPGHQGQPPPPPPHWQQPQQQHQYNMGHGETTNSTTTTTSPPPGATAGDAVRRGHEDGQHPWQMMHYATPYTAGHFAPPTDGAPQHAEHHPYHHHHHAETTSDNEVNGDVEEHGVKRQRVV